MRQISHVHAPSVESLIPGAQALDRSKDLVTLVGARHACFRGYEVSVGASWLLGPDPSVAVDARARGEAYAGCLGQLGAGVGIEAGASAVVYVGAVSGEEGEGKAGVGVVVRGDEGGNERTDDDGYGVKGLEEEQDAEARSVHGWRGVVECGRYRFT